MDTVRKFVERMYRALDEEELGPFLALCAADVVVEYPAEGRLPYGGTWSGKQRVADFLERHDAAEEVLALDISDIAVADAIAFVRGRFTGMAKPAGQQWATDFVHVLTVRDDQLQRWQSFFDTAAAVEAHRPR